MPDGEVKILFRTEAELQGGEQYLKQLEKTIGSNKAAGQPVDDLVSKHDTLAESLTRSREALQQLQAAQAGAPGGTSLEAAKAALAEAEAVKVKREEYVKWWGQATANQDVDAERQQAASAAEAVEVRQATEAARASTVDYTTDQKRLQEALEESGKKLDSAKEKTGGLSQAINRSLNPVSALKSLLTGFVSALFISPVIGGFRQLHAVLLDILSLGNPLAGLGDTLKTTFLDVNRHLEVLAGSAKVFAENLRTIETAAGDAERRLARLQELQSERLTAEDRIANAAEKVERAEIEKRRAAGDLSEPEAARELAGVEMKYARAAMTRQKTRERLAVEQAGGEFSIEWNRVLATRNQLGQLEAGKPGGALPAATLRQERTKAELDRAQADLARLYEASGEPILPLDAARIIEQRTGTHRYDLSTLPGKKDPLEAITETTNLLEQEIPRLKERLDQETAQIEAIKNYGQQLTTLTDKLAATEAAAQQALENFEQMQQRTGIRLDALEKAASLEERGREINLDTGDIERQKRQEEQFLEREKRRLRGEPDTASVDYDVLNEGTHRISFAVQNNTAMIERLVGGIEIALADQSQRITMLADRVTNEVWTLNSRMRDNLS